jgi:ribose transport system ATP-binding protein
MSASRDIRITGLTKSFGRNRVLHGIDLEIRAGEFVGLMGPNGAGKSTLIKILDGVYKADSGEIAYGEQSVRSLADLTEVGFIHQDLGLVESLTIMENLRLGQDPLRMIGPILHHRREREAARRAIARVHLERPVDTLVGDLSAGEKTLVAVARLLDRGARVLFVDEATSTLPPADSRQFIAALRRTVEEGATVIMVSHKLSEILDSTQRVVVLLDGRLASDVSAQGLQREQLVRMLVAHEAEGHDLRPIRRAPGEELLRLDAVRTERVGPIDLQLRSGEIVGLTGLPGSGLHDVAFLANGSTRPRSGEVVKAPGVRTALVPPHRESQGGFDLLSVRQNLTVSALSRWRHRSRLLRPGEELREVEEMVASLSITPSDCELEYGTLSGGNKQKVVFGRVLFRRPRVYVLCEPTRGVDVGTRAEIYRLINELRDQDAAVLVVTSDSEDLFAVCDRISVVDAGSLGEFVPIDSASAEELEAFI